MAAPRPARACPDPPPPRRRARPGRRDPLRAGHPAPDLRPRQGRRAAARCTRSSPARSGRRARCATDADFADPWSSTARRRWPPPTPSSSRPRTSSGPVYDGGRADRRAGRRPRPHPARHPARLHLHRRLRPRRRRAISTAARPPRTGRDADHFQRLFPQVRVDPDVLFVDDGDVLTSAGRRRRDRPVPAHRAPRPRHRRRQRGGPPHRRTAAPRRRPGAVHPAPGARAAAGDHDRRPRLGARPPARADPAARHGRAGVDERTHLHPPLPRGGRRQPRPVAHPAAGGTGPAAAGVHRPVRRPGGPRRGLRHGPVDAPAPAGGPRRHPDRVPAHLPDRHRAPATDAPRGRPTTAIGTPALRT